jgi:argininosuccinate lyase
MDNGRLSSVLSPRCQHIIYGTPAPATITAELGLISQVDLAHVVMLVEQGLVPPHTGAELLEYVLGLRQQAFAPLLDVGTPRGLYLAYEQHLADILGPETGGRLHTGRSRNDLKATTTALRLRTEALGLVAELQRLRAVLLARARAYHEVVMVAYTHFQAAMPVTFGYYLLGLAIALGRDARAVADAARPLAYCPLGAGAVAGTDLAINPARTAELLGFEMPPRHALDAVASRDTALRLLAAATGAALTISRLAVDLQLWSTAEFAFVEFPDSLVGGSSAMPQKRNVFLLEHVKAKPAIAIGAWTTAASAMMSAPFTNSIQVGTEAVAAIWPGLAAVKDAVQLAQVLVRAARPCPGRMRDRASCSYVTATAVANDLVRRGVPFRTAHHMVGAAVQRAISEGTDELKLSGDPRFPATPRHTLEDVISRSGAGGPGQFGDAFAAARRELAEQGRWLEDARARQRAADKGLAEAVNRTLASRAGHV